MSLDLKNPWKTFSYPKGEKQWFLDGGWKRWAKEYYDVLFTLKDIRKVRNRINRVGREKPEFKENNYFHEWKAAIELYTKHKCRSVLALYSPEKETSSPHRKKAEEVRGRVPPKVWNVIKPRKKGATQKKNEKTAVHAGLPDLFVYRDDNKDKWFYFAEVKGPGDRIGAMQKKKSKLLDDAAGKEVSGIIKLEMTTEPFTPPR